jgi:nicotinamide riboside transporter PnuC
MDITLFASLKSAWGAYLGLDWASMLFGFLGMYLLGNRNPVGFICAIIACALALIVSLMAEQNGFIVANIINSILAGLGLYKWRRSATRSVAESAKIR